MKAMDQAKRSQSAMKYSLNQSSGRHDRDSSLELLKIIAMIAIVCSHVVQSLLPNESGGGLYITEFSTYYLDYRMASVDPSMWLLVCLRTLGAWGNTIFVICSSWFLCRQSSVKLSKVIKMVLDVFAISVSVLLVAILLGVRPEAKEILKSFFPITFANNWFITCYLLLYAIHPALNLVFEKLGKRGHATLALVMASLYMFLPIVHDGHFYINEFIIMVSEYVIVAFAHYYLPDTLRSTRAGRGAFLLGTLGTLLAVLVLEQAGFRIGALSDKMLHFDKDGNPLLFLSAFGLFNIARTRPFVSVRVNRTAPLMLLVYLIHENPIVRVYARPAIWQLIYDSLGYNLLFVWVVGFTVCLFLCALFLSFIYGHTVGILVDHAVPVLERVLVKYVDNIVDLICVLK